MLKDVNFYLAQLYGSAPDFASFPAFKEIRSIEEARNRGYFVCNVAKFFLSVLDGVKAVDDSFTHEEIEKVLVENEK